MSKRNPTAKKVALAPQRKKSAGPIDLDAVRDLAQIAADFDLAEVEADASGHIRVSRRGGGGHAYAPPVATSSTSPISLVPSATPEARNNDEGVAVVASPFVGTFYRAANPESAAFTDVGQTVRKGQVVCIVEAMKLMNEIESDYAGKVVEILVENGEHVEYGQALFRIKKS